MNKTNHHVQIAGPIGRRAINFHKLIFIKPRTSHVDVDKVAYSARRKLLSLASVREPLPMFRERIHYHASIDSNLENVEQVVIREYDEWVRCVHIEQDGKKSLNFKVKTVFCIVLYSSP